MSFGGICILLLPFWLLSNFLYGPLKQSCGRKLWVEGMGLGWFPCVQPQSIFSWHSFLLYLGQICFLLLYPFMVSVSLSYLPQPDFAPGMRGTVSPGGHMGPHQSPLQKERELTLVSVPCPAFYPGQLALLTRPIEKGAEQCLSVAYCSLAW